ncbi:hypothetical protein B7494_g3314 [Chlorociboria aeruginascens]|nr:hypothetical protein B7494_g3314 [Chlorociboria aeruginascens]
MADQNEQPNSLEDLQALHKDLVALCESRFVNLERLETEIEAHITAFKNLLRKNPRNEQSRQKLASGKIEALGQEYEINTEFQQNVLQLADEVDLDELEAAQICLESQDYAAASGRSILDSSVIRFHQRRKYLLHSLRLILQLAGDVDQEEGIRDAFAEVVTTITRPPSLRPSTNSNVFVSQCLQNMKDVKNSLQNLAEKSNSASVLGHGQELDVSKMIEYQRVSLVNEHESLGVIVSHLVKANYSVIEDFESMVNILRKADKYDNLLLHYFPALGAFISRFGAVDGGGSMEDARSLNDNFIIKADQGPWILGYVHAAFRAWWLAEYSGWYGENYDGSIPNVDLNQESTQRSKQFTEALKDGAFDFILSLSADVKPLEWYDPARHALRQWLQRKAPALLPDSISFSDFFQGALMDQLETFIENFITNLPDVLRKLRIDEDEQRQLSQKLEHDLDLERFIVIISYAFDGRPKAAFEGIWNVPDGALVGFMHWASRRASTPLVSAFCEMLQALAGDETCATAAHEFLLDEGSPVAGKMRRSHALTWNQIFKELTFFCAKIRDQPALPQSQGFRAGKQNSGHTETEPESEIMLESYLRLITRLCMESSVARQFLAQHPTFHLTELLFQLASSSILPRLRACAFTTLRSILSHKTKAAGEYLWAALDVWISDGYSPGSHMLKTSPTAPTSASSIKAMFQKFDSGFEEPNAFIQLLHALVLPYEEEVGLNDGLPFPEGLGASSRMPGIDPYIDFAIGQVFATRATDISDPVQLRLLRLTCLNFITACLDTFNEDLVIFANRSNVSIDAAISTSNLETYVRLHPFSRVMEWMFNEKVMDTLFSTIHQDIEEVGSAAPDSPLIMCILQGIHLVTMIIELQPTYLDIIRPLLKSQASNRRPLVSNAAFSSFEDGILNHLIIIPDLGLYCGSGHDELVIASLKLLGKLSSSPKLASTPSTGLGTRTDRNKAIAALESNNDSETISKYLLQEMGASIDQGPESSSYLIKLQILDTLKLCLQASPNHPTITHLLLGFQCSNDTLEIDPTSPLNNETSLFHTILALALQTPVETIENGAINIPLWLISLKHKCQQLLRQLWRSSLSSDFALPEMRSKDSVFAMFINLIVIRPGILWDGIDLADPSFLSSSSTLCLAELLTERAVVFQYISAELRQVARSHLPSLKRRIVGTLLGSSTDGNKQIENASVFDLFDFMDLELSATNSRPILSWFGYIDLQACLEDHDDAPSTHNITKVEELLALRRAELRQSGKIENPLDAAAVDSQAQELINFYIVDNQMKHLWASRLSVLSAWVQLILIMIESGDFDTADKTSFVLRALDVILPRLENNLGNIPEATHLARLAKSLLFSLELDSKSFKAGDMGDLVSERLFYLFQVSLRAIVSLGSNATLKEIFYSICYRYLTGMSDVSGVLGHRRHSTQTIKAAGDRLVDLICDDAHGGEQSSQIAALLLLGALVNLARIEKSKYVIDSLNRLNFTGILVNSIQTIAAELQQTPREAIDMQLANVNARLALLLQMSQTRQGATAVLNAGLFHSIKISGLFAADPDFGVDINAPDALTKHYLLLTAVMRVILAGIISRGPQNEATLTQGRVFLTENRLSILAVLKRSAGLGAKGDGQIESIEELAETYLLCISVTGFLDFEEQTTQRRQALNAFT